MIKTILVKKHTKFTEICELIAKALNIKTK